jgi:hypothetical protein
MSVKLHNNGKLGPEEVNNVKLTLQEKELIKIRNLLEMYVLVSPTKHLEYAERVKDSIERAEKEA